jgi:16S rRNA (adenine1518-N6/adenine1519-N6)-dimethyltransferase
LDTNLPDLLKELKKSGLFPEKRLGQHFLFDRNILQKIVESAPPLKGRWVLEIGPGPGGLTRELLLSGARVIAVEKDQR